MKILEQLKKSGTALLAVFLGQLLSNILFIVVGFIVFLGVVSVIYLGHFDKVPIGLIAIGVTLTSISKVLIIWLIYISYKLFYKKEFCKESLKIKDNKYIYKAILIIFIINLIFGIIHPSDIQFNNADPTVYFTVIIMLNVISIIFTNITFTIITFRKLSRKFKLNFKNEIEGDDDVR